MFVDGRDLCFKKVHSSSNEQKKRLDHTSFLSSINYKFQISHTCKTRVLHSSIKLDSNIKLYSDEENTYTYICVYRVMIRDNSYIHI